ncbi:hypothetical protein DPMN_011639 [Dreissena polymorpha]|uniref:Uncharacterized protein n=1 Tax=Dreissena polymorpha TaxID=45954 RepID=A0A9D4N4D7_DREPO|nr:hypothetical protein DPMN_011639 [Dreissena polymorpha]
MAGASVLRRYRLISWTVARQRQRKHLPSMFSLIKNESQVRRRSDTVCYLTINDSNCRSAVVDQMTPRADPGKPKFLGSGGSMVAKLKLKGIDGRAPPGVEPVA